VRDGHPMVIEERAPAKLNLRLRFTGRRTDGYHCLSMLNVGTSLCDVVSVHRGEGVTCTLLGPLAKHAALGATANNLVVRAATLFSESFSLSPQFALTLEKRIPIGSGLGGGSSDAAATLRALVRLCRADIDRKGVSQECLQQKLRACAVRLGADVPFFLECRSAVVTGIGDEIQPLSVDPFLGISAVIVVPPVAVETPTAYALVRKAHPQLPVLQDEELHTELAHCVAAERGALARLVRNDFEPVIASAYPPIRDLLAALRELPRSVVGMTGSGSALFVLPTDGQAGDAETNARLRRIAQYHGAELHPVVLGTAEIRPLT